MIDTGKYVKMKQRAETAEAKLASLLSEVVSDQLAPSVNVPWMRGSLGLPEYVRGLEQLIRTQQAQIGILFDARNIERTRAERAEAACAEMRAIVESCNEESKLYAEHEGLYWKTLASNYGKGWLPPEKVKVLTEALRGLLASADCSWLEQKGGHDWEWAVAVAQKALAAVGKVRDCENERSLGQVEP